jgi:hypothetical protein
MNFFALLEPAYNAVIAHVSSFCASLDLSATEMTVLFLFSCILMARTFVRLDMHAASMAYSITFIVILFVLLFTLDIDIVRTAMVNVCGIDTYTDVREAFFDAMSTGYYGLSMLGALVLTTIVQLVLFVLNALREMVCYLFVRKQVARKFTKAYVRFAQSVRTLYLPKRINLLYCRMLN